MDVPSIANRLVELCRTADFATAQDELYASDAVSIEPENSPWETASGIEALNAKVAHWNQMVKEVHKVETSDPVIAGPFFSLRMAFDLTYQDGTRNQGEEICVFEVLDGKIVKEHFFYRM